MTIVSIIGLVILVIGVFLIGFGLRGTQTLTNKVVEGITGHYTRRTMWLLIGGGLLILIGLIFLFMGWHVPLVSQP
jgi:hypothetical protein